MKMMIMIATFLTSTVLMAANETYPELKLDNMGNNLNKIEKTDIKENELKSITYIWGLNENTNTNNEEKIG